MYTKKGPAIDRNPLMWFGQARLLPVLSQGDLRPSGTDGFRVWRGVLKDRFGFEALIYWGCIGAICG